MSETPGLSFAHLGGLGNGGWRGALRIAKRQVSPIAAFRFLRRAFRRGRLAATILAPGMARPLSLKDRKTLPTGNLRSRAGRCTPLRSVIHGRWRDDGQGRGSGAAGPGRAGRSPATGSPAVSSSELVAGRLQDAGMRRARRYLRHLSSSLARRPVAFWACFFRSSKLSGGLPPFSILAKVA